MRARWTHQRKSPTVVVTIACAVSFLKDHELRWVWVHFVVTRLIAFLYDDSDMTFDELPHICICDK